MTDNREIPSPDTEFSELEADFESFLDDGDSINALESDTPPGSVTVPPTLNQEQIEASGAFKRARKLVPPGRSGLRNRIIRKVLKKAGLSNVPPLDDLFRGKVGPWVKIKDIALFSSQPEDELLAELARESYPGWNRAGNAGIVVKRMEDVGIQIFRDGRMYTPIHVAQVEDNILECISGRHRLAFLVLVYGGECKIPVYLESMSLGAARHAMAVANDCRPVKALEHAEHAALAAVAGNADAEQDELYKKIARNKNTSNKYCVYSVIKRGYPTPVDFGVSTVPSPVGDDITTVANLEDYWNASLNWSREMSREDFDTAISNSTVFLNRLSWFFRALEGFVPKRHMSSPVLIAIGKYYKNYVDVNGIDALAGIDTLGDDYINKIAVMIVTMESIEDKGVDKVYAGLVEAFTHQ